MEVPFRFFFSLEKDDKLLKKRAVTSYNVGAGDWVRFVVFFRFAVSPLLGGSGWWTGAVTVVRLSAFCAVATGKRVVTVGSPTVLCFFAMKSSLNYLAVNGL